MESLSFKKLMRMFILGLLCFYGVVYAEKEESYDESLTSLLFDEIPKVFVSSMKLETIDETPSNIYVVKGVELYRRGYRSLFDLLKDLPGVTYENQIGNERNGAIITRGLIYSRRIKVLLNGMDLGEKAGFGFGWDQRIPIEGIERVEFILGPYASLYGRNSFSGVLNIITKTGEDIDGGSLNLVYGEWDRFQSSLIYGKKINAFDVYFSFFKNFSDEGQDLTEEYPEIYSRKSREGQTGVFGETVVFPEGISERWDMFWDDTEIYTRIKHDQGFIFDLEWNRAEWPGVGTYLTPLFYTSSKESIDVDEYFNVRLQYQYESDRFSNLTTVHYQEWDHKMLLTYLDGLYRWWVSYTEGIQYENQLRFNLTDKNSLFFSVSYEDVDAVGLTPSGRTNPPQKPDLSGLEVNLTYLNISLQDEIIFNDQFKTVFGLMFESSNSYSDVYVPRLSAIYKVNDRTTIKALYGGGYVTPDLLVRSDQIFPSNSIKGTTSIDPEYLDSYELNLIHYFSDQVLLNASIYLNQVKDVIALADSPLLPAPFGSEYKNIGSKETKGIDVTVDAKLNDKIKLFTSMSFVDGFIKEPENGGELIKKEYLPMSSSFHAKIGLHWLCFNENIDFYVHDLFIDEIDTWNENQTLPGYNIVDVNISTTPVFSKRWRLSFGIQNLFDKKGFDASYQNSVVVPDKVPIKRQNFSLQIGVNW